MAADPIHPPYSIATLSQILIAEAFQGMEYTTDAYLSRVYAEVRAALVDLQSEPWDWRVRSQSIGINTSGVNLISEFDTALTEVVVYNGVDGQKHGAPYCTETEYLARLKMNLPACTVRHDDGEQLWKVYVNAPGASGPAEFAYLFRTLPTGDEEAVNLPSGWHNVWYLAARWRVIEHVARDHDRAVAAKANFDAVMARLREDHLILTAKRGRGGGSMPSSDADRIPSQVIEQLIGDMGELGMPNASAAFCQRAARRAFREALNAVNWPNLLQSAKHTLGNVLPVDFFPSWNQTTLIGAGVKLTLMRPNDYAVRATRPEGAGLPNAWTFTLEVGDPASFRSLGSGSGTLIYRRAMPYAAFDDLNKAIDGLTPEMADAWYARARLLALELHGPEPASRGGNALEAARKSWVDMVTGLQAAYGEPDSTLDVSSDFADLSTPEDLVEQLMVSLEAMGAKPSRGECSNAVRRGFVDAWRAGDTHRIAAFQLSGAGEEQTLDNYLDFEAMVPGATLVATDDSKVTYRYVTPDEYSRLPSNATDPAFTAVWNNSDARYHLWMRPAMNGNHTFRGYYLRQSPALVFTARVSAPAEIVSLWFLGSRKYAYAAHAGIDAVAAARNQAVAEYDAAAGQLRARQDASQARYREDMPDEVRRYVSSVLASMGLKPHDGLCDMAMSTAFRSVWYGRPWAIRFAAAENFDNPNALKAAPADFADFAPGSAVRSSDVNEHLPIDFDRFSQLPTAPSSKFVAKIWNSGTAAWDLAFKPQAISGSYTVTYLRKAPVLLAEIAVDLPEHLLNAWKAAAVLEALRSHAADPAKLTTGETALNRAMEEAAAVDQALNPGFVSDAKPDELRRTLEAEVIAQGKTPGRLLIEDAIAAAWREVWALRPWAMRTVSAALLNPTATTAAPPDFDSFAARSVARKDDATVYVPTPLGVFHALPATPNGRFMTRQWNSVTTGWDLLFTPTPAAGTYRLTYLRKAPALTAQTAADAPQSFWNLWRGLARVMVFRAHGIDVTVSQGEYQETAKREIGGADEQDAGYAGSSKPDEVRRSIEAFLAGLGVPPIREIIRDAVETGLRSAWYARMWPMRRSTGTLDAPGLGDEAPEDFADFASGTQLVGADGSAYNVVDLSTFNVLPASPVGHFATRELVDGTWEIHLRPSGGSTYTFTYLRTAPTVVDAVALAVPEAFLNLWKAFAITHAVAWHTVGEDVRARADLSLKNAIEAAGQEELATTDHGFYGEGTIGELEQWLYAYLTPHTTHPSRGACRQAVRDAVRDLWNLRRWTFRYARFNLEVVLGSETAVLPEDFDELDVSMVIWAYGETGERFRLCIQEAEEIRRLQSCVESTFHGRPVSLAIDYDVGTQRYVARVWPTSDGAYTYPIRYLRRTPTMDDPAASIELPDDFLKALRSAAKINALRGVPLNPTGQAALADALREGTDDRRGLVPKDRPQFNEGLIDVYRDFQCNGGFGGV